MASTAEQLRQYRGPVLFSFGFRPFFLFGALLASILPMLTALSMAGAVTISGAYGAIAYHGHEMVFGFLAAIVTGFVMTAVPNWTGRLPVLGWRLIGLFSLWLAGRIAMAASGAIGAQAAAVIDCMFLIVVDLIVLREIAAGKNWRNLPVCFLIGLFALGNVLWHSQATANGAGQFGLRWGIAIIAILLALIGGRVTPSFTRNWFMKNKIPVADAPFAIVDKLALGAIVVAMIVWLAAPTGIGTGVLLFAASALHLCRLARWRGWLTTAEPLVTILHVGYLWLAVALLFLGAAAAFPECVSVSTAFHALTAGAAGVMTLAVMTRATRGHTGRALTADAPTIAIYGLVNLGAASRIAASFWLSNYSAALTVAAALWSSAFLLFSLVYGRYLLSPKLTS
jgi:uncharacterized protein involved in response to NO